MKRSIMIVLIPLFFSCGSGNKTIPGKLITIDKAFIDSIKNTSDTTYLKRYRNNEFVTAEYYLNRKDHTVSQFMKDSGNNIRQVFIEKGRKKLFGAEYYKNGQLKALLPLDSWGKNSGLAKYYYETGDVRSEGIYKGGFHVGNWKNFDKNGEIISIDTYDDNGQLIKTNKTK